MSRPPSILPDLSYPLAWGGKISALLPRDRIEKVAAIGKLDARLIPDRAVRVGHTGHRLVKSPP
jgi:hypothetical protein